MSTFEVYQRSITDHFAGMSERMVVLVKAVYDHADEHYNHGGWDVIAECFEPREVAGRMNEDMTVAEAIDSWRFSVDVWADRQADARNSAF
ncbi:hypothetical protein ACFOOK_26360 [Micromonospora krabiensis]|uniref:Uncharacterized protein n=1 Tax=Micromonospora krabiensis TaxID=307121 RepID=A0A1C3N5N6_9ACTN|nr:hypothetical protein [Micromonospora krabiensis]SBV27909.1 hypothetical protein GA0070620_3440 [Micromonospora krabiensis]